MRCINLCLPCQMHSTSRPHPAISLAASVPSWRSFHAAAAFRQAPRSKEDTQKTGHVKTQQPQSFWTSLSVFLDTTVRTQRASDTPGWIPSIWWLSMSHTSLQYHMCSNSHCCFSYTLFIAFAERTRQMQAQTCPMSYVSNPQLLTRCHFRLPAQYGRHRPSLFIVTPCRASLKPFELLSLRRRASSLAQIPMNWSESQQRWTWELNEQSLQYLNRNSQEWGNCWKQLQSDKWSAPTTFWGIFVQINTMDSAHWRGWGSDSTHVKLCEKPTLNFHQGVLFHPKVPLQAALWRFCQTATGQFSSLPRLPQLVDVWWMELTNPLL